MVSVVMTAGINKVCSLCGITPLRSNNTDGICQRTAECNAARQRARYARLNGALPACRACGLPLARRGYRQHKRCRTGTRAILLARLAADLEQLAARRLEREQDEAQARRQAWEQGERRRLEREQARAQAMAQAQAEREAARQAEREQWRPGYGTSGPKRGKPTPEQHSEQARQWYEAYVSWRRARGVPPEGWPADGEMNSEVA